MQEVCCAQFLQRGDCAVTLPVEFNTFEVNTLSVLYTNTLAGYLHPTKVPRSVTNKSSIFLVFKVSLPSRLDLGVWLNKCVLLLVFDFFLYLTFPPKNPKHIELYFKTYAIVQIINCN